MCLAIILAGIGFASNAQADEENYTCGTPDETGGALGKAAMEDFPARKKWPASLKALFIRVALSDAPFTTTDATIAATHATINATYGSMSRNTFQWDFQIYPTTLQAPGTAASYAASFNTLQTWCTGQIAAAGLKRGTDYDVMIFSFPHIGYSWAGISNLRDWDFINGTYSPGVTGHELGHTLGLPHSHSIEAGTDLFGTPGTSSQTNEYGNPYDIMGRGGSAGHFNVMYKWRISWVDSNELLEVKSSGLYRVYAMDNAVHKNRLIGLRVATGNPAYAYWIEYRTTNTNARTGATVEFQGFNGTNNYDNWFLDMTPQSRTSQDESDGPLVPGKSFTDKYAGANGAMTIQAVAINSGVWTSEGWVDLQITIPGTVPILASTPRGLRVKGMDPGMPAFNLMGRTLQSLSPGQAAFQKRKDAYFVINAR